LRNFGNSFQIFPEIHGMMQLDSALTINIIVAPEETMAFLARVIFTVSMVPLKIGNQAHPYPMAKAANMPQDLPTTV
jgi:hypothetical protein